MTHSPVLIFSERCRFIQAILIILQLQWFKKRIAIPAIYEGMFHLHHIVNTSEMRYFLHAEEVQEVKLTLLNLTPPPSNTATLLSDPLLATCRDSD